MTTAFELAPTAVHRGEGDLPFVTLPDPTRLQLLQVDLANGVWVIRTLFPPGVTVQTHKHTGHVYAFTQSGSWHYLESPEAVNTPGSYLFEPAGSVHTLHVPETNDGDTDAWFVIHGANLNLTPEGTWTWSSTPPASSPSTGRCARPSTASPTRPSSSSRAERAGRGPHRCRRAASRPSSVDDPTPGPGQVVARVTRLRDLRERPAHRRGATARPGTILGHEIAGVIDEVGEGVDDRWAPGTAVTARPFTSCGDVRLLPRRAARPLPAPSDLLGLHAPGRVRRAGGARARTSSTRLPASVTGPDQALVEPLAVALHGLRRAGLRRRRAPGRPRCRARSAWPSPPGPGPWARRRWS